ncbi:MAG TPA: DUF262 domain-containing HNH endonuclease family protein [Kouleothrix sp.]|uniref:DUF262 domain-containing protein n=1 Tax=Kouleothrix sp. TaxID=2779161 RepID=UPI002BCAF74F|nr:DUF262 domain-containing HNH endonuclease family protein [Kouleothrix sp.]
MIEATENLPFGKLLLQRFPLKIPRYQRSYAWDEEEIEEFVHDIRDIYTMRLNTPGKQMAHFFGGVVSVKRTVAGTRSGDEYDIVDGQQRLTTVTIALNALLSGFEKIAVEAMSQGNNTGAQTANAHSDVINNTHLVYPEVEQGQVKHHHRINLSKADDSFFKEILENAGNSRTQTIFQRDSHRRLQQAWRYIYEELIHKPIISDTSHSIDEKINKLLILHSCLTVDCYVIHIISDNHQEAYRLFSILNDRGKNLSDGDLLRSYTLEMLEGYDSQQAQTEATWDEILGYKDLEIDYFLKAYYPSYQGKRAPQRGLANEYRSTFFKYPGQFDASHANNVRDRVLDMGNNVEAFIDISDGQWPYQSTILPAWDRDRLQRLIKTLKHTICIPLLLSASQCLAENLFAEIVHLLERFSFRYITIVGAHASRLGNVYNAQAKLIRQNPSTYNLSLLQTQLNNLQINHAKDHTFEVGLLDQLNYGITSNRLIIRHFLSTIEDYYYWCKKGGTGNLNPDRTRLFDIATLTIEHIHAKNPTSPNPDLDPIVNNLGNLSFWGGNDNSKAGNKPFNLKRSDYSGSSIALNRDLATLSIWDINEVRKRQKLLIDMALKIFSA